MTDIDLYEFKKTLKKFENDKFIDFVEQKGIAVLEVGKTSKYLDKTLLAEGYKMGDKVLVIVQ
jgi:hypothetical protein